MVLPIGSTRKEVEAWLTSQGTYQNEIVDEDGRSLGIAAEKTVYKGFFYNLELQMYFYFDQEGKLYKRWLRVVSVGL